MHLNEQLIIESVYEGKVPNFWGESNQEILKLAKIAAIAWHMTKKPEDPEFMDAEENFQSWRLEEVRNMIQGITPVTSFERAALNIINMDLYVQSQKQLEANNVDSTHG